MHTDHGMITGTHHSFAAQPCQDYCQSGEIPDGAWAAISDGCSGAKGRSDLGARAMVLSAEAVLKERGASIMDSPAVFQDAVLHACRAWLEPVSEEDLFATLCVVAGNRSALHAMVWGDGAILIK